MDVCQQLPLCFGPASLACLYVTAAASCSFLLQNSSPQRAFLACLRTCQQCALLSINPRPLAVPACLHPAGTRAACVSCWRPAPHRFQPTATASPRCTMPPCAATQPACASSSPHTSGCRVSTHSSKRICASDCVRKAPAAACILPKLDGGCLISSLVRSGALAFSLLPTSLHPLRPCSFLFPLLLFPANLSLTSASGAAALQMASVGAPLMPWCLM